MAKISHWHAGENVSLLDQLNSPEAWQTYLNYKVESGNLKEELLEDLRLFIENCQYEPVVQGILAGEPFAIPRKKLISKTDSQKKRVLYVFPREENYVLKLLTYLLIRKYDHLFTDQLYSFRATTNTKKAIKSLVSHANISQMYSYKVDVSDYFASVDVPTLLPLLKGSLSGDPALYGFFERVLSDKRVYIEQELCQENKGIIAGSPLSTFCANVYLNNLDHSFAQGPYPYARYSDDIIVFAPTREEVDACELRIKRELANKHLGVNPKKETRTAPGEQWSFLGISYCDGVIDISAVSVMKLKKKMRRKSRALLRWADKKGIDREYGAKAFIKSFNKKLYEGARNNDLTWARWFFPIINTDVSLREIDEYMQDCIRFVATGKRTKSRYNFRYEDMKRLGYRSLVHEYYADCSQKK